MEESLLSRGNKAFYMEAVKIGFPIMIQQLIIFAVGLCDTIMVGKLSTQALAAVGSANQITMVYLNTVFGFLSGVGVFAVQYWGIRDLKTLRKLLGVAYSVVLAAGVPMTILAWVFAPELISIFSKDAEVVAIGTEYMRIAVFTFIITGITFTISYNSRAIAMLKWPTVFNAVAVSVNIFLNWVLIFGKFGMPAMGAKGAAAATLISRVIELSMLLLYVYLSKGHPLRATLRELKYEKELLKRVVRTAYPVVLNEFLWILSFSTTYAIYGQIDAKGTALAVSQISMTVSDIFMAIFCGIANACMVIVGQELGRGNTDAAFLSAKKCLRLVWAANIICTVGLILSRGFVIGIYDYEPEVNKMIMDTLLVSALTMSPRMLSYTFICGILRPGGDTVWGFFVDAGLNWLLNVPLAFISVYVLKWPLAGCMALVAIGEVVKTIASYRRFYSKKWMNIFTGR